MSQATKLIVIGVIVSSLLGLCLVVGGVGAYVALATKSRAALWEPVVAEKDSLRQQLLEDLQALQSKHDGTIPSQERSAFIKRANELDQRISSMMHTDPHLRGKAPPEIDKKLGGTLLSEAMQALTVAEQAARKKFAELAADRRQQQQDELQQQIEAISEVERQAVAKKALARQHLEAERIESEIESYYEVPGKFGEQRELTAEQEALIKQMRAIETSLRSALLPEEQFASAIDEYIKLQDQMIDADPQEQERLRRAAASTPAAITSTAPLIATNEKPVGVALEDPTPVPTPLPAVAPATPTVEPMPPVEPQQPVAGALPGFAVEHVSHLRVGAKVLVRTRDKWVPATIEAKRSKLFEVRYAPGDLAAVTPDRIRWQEDPAAP